MLTAMAVVLFVVDVAIGSVDIPLGDVWASLTGGDVAPGTRRIVTDIRLVKALTAVLAGGALSVSGLQMQTMFQNPLAGPYVLGISSGAGLGVALFMLGAPLLGAMGVSVGGMGIAAMAWLGAAAVLAVIAAVGARIRDIMVILILGMMLGSALGAVVQVLQYFSDEASLKAYVVWTMGSLTDVTWGRMWVMLPAVAVGMVIAVATVKVLNLMLLGDDYARTMGLNIKRGRLGVFASTTLLAGTVTAFCGPIAFIGLAMPHVARWLLGSADHRVLIPGAFLVGTVVLLACDIAARFATVPVNALTSLLGIPIVVWIVMKNR